MKMWPNQLCEARPLVGLCAMLVMFVLNVAVALDNGLALTPPMGFNNWERFRCNIDCDNYPDSCISEQLFMTIADAMVARGYRDAGYQYVNIDDCWFNDTRDPTTGRLEPNPLRFPSGMKALAAYIHSKELKFGLYQDVGVKTCAGYPGLKGFESVDAQTYADWDVDYVKVDGCNIDPTEFDVLYPLFGKALNDTGRPILYSCEWPVYQVENTTNYPALRETCNLWRNYHDIVDSFESMRGIVDHFATNPDFRKYSGPGGWNDPDMLVIGDYGLSVPQSQAQFALWAILAAPLLVSADVRKMRPEFEEILLNKEIIAINQDALGIMGERIDNGSTTQNGGVQIWRRPVLPTTMVDNVTLYSYALVFWYPEANGNPIMIERSLGDLGLDYANGYLIRNLFFHADDGGLKPRDELQLFIDPSGGVIMLKATLDVDDYGVEKTEIYAQSALLNLQWNADNNGRQAATTDDESDSDAADESHDQQVVLPHAIIHATSSANRNIITDAIQFYLPVLNLANALLVTFLLCLLVIFVLIVTQIAYDQRRQMLRKSATFAAPAVTPSSAHNAGCPKYTPSDYVGEITHVDSDGKQFSVQQIKALEAGRYVRM